jgi:hypothetical protein
MVRTTNYVKASGERTYLFEVSNLMAEVLARLASSVLGFVPKHKIARP